MTGYFKLKLFIPLYNTDLSLLYGDERRVVGMQQVVSWLLGIANQLFRIQVVCNALIQAAFKTPIN
jgi:hypothetical protein